MTDEVVFKQDYAIDGGDFSNAGKVSTDVKRTLKSIGLSAVVIRRLAIAVYEAEMNVVSYAVRGKLNLEVLPHVVRVSVVDRGQGIEDIEVAMQEGYSTATEKIREMGFGAGMGLPNIKRNVDVLHIKSAVGVGTSLRMEVNLA